MSVATYGRLKSKKRNNQWMNLISFVVVIFLLYSCSSNLVDISHVAHVECRDIPISAFTAARKLVVFKLCRNARDI